MQGAAVEIDKVEEEEVIVEERGELQVSYESIIYEAAAF